MRRHTPALMLQGTGSHAGKTVLAAGLCRLLTRAGLRVLPFKAQNMSNNAWVTDEGQEMGWAQAMQAEAAGVAPVVDMNPVPLKPESAQRCQVIRLRRPLVVSGRHRFVDGFEEATVGPQEDPSRQRGDGGEGGRCGAGGRTVAEQGWAAA